MSKPSYNFDYLPDRKHTESSKWGLFDNDVLPMWVADMDFYCPPEVTRALAQRVQHGIFGYGKPIPELFEVTAAWIQNHYHWKVDPGDLVCLPGVVTGFNLATRAVTQPGEGLLIQTPVYPPFLKVADNHKLVQQDMQLTWDRENLTYSMDLDIFKSTIDERSKILVFCNPHNPSGRVFRRDELEEIAEICLQNGIFICSDEIHADFIFPESKHIPIASLDHDLEMNSITLIAPSKTFNIAGLDCSFAIIKNPEVRRKFELARSGLVGGVNILGQVAALAAYKYGAEWLQEVLVYLEGNRNFTLSFIRQELPGISMPYPEGTYLAWLECTALNLPSKPCDFFLENARLGLMDGTQFGAGGENFVRLNFGCPRSLLEQGLQRMKTAVDNLL